MAGAADVALPARGLVESDAAQLGQHVRSIGMTSDLMEGRMYPLTVNGIDEMTRELSH